MIKNSKKGERLMPLGYGISVNTPFITSLTNDSCIDPTFVQTRLTGGADYDIAVYNKTSGLFNYQNIVPAGGNQCINGDCSLPGETDVLNKGCQASISVFTVDYDAPLGKSQEDVRHKFAGIAPYHGAGKNPPHGYGKRSGVDKEARKQWSARWNLEDGQ